MIEVIVMVGVVTNMFIQAFWLMHYLKHHPGLPDKDTECTK